MGGFKFIGDLLADINQGVTINGSIGLVENILGIEYDKSPTRPEPKESAPQHIEIVFNCPYDFCERCGECGREDWEDLEDEEQE